MEQFLGLESLQKCQQPTKQLEKAKTATGINKQLYSPHHLWYTGPQRKQREIYQLSIRHSDFRGLPEKFGTDNCTVGQQKEACVFLWQIDVVLRRHSFIALGDGKEIRVHVCVNFDSAQWFAYSSGWMPMQWQGDLWKFSWSFCYSWDFWAPTLGTPVIFPSLELYTLSKATSTWWNSR